jgi:S-formylglutathione hydrolase FrmB
LNGSDALLKWILRWSSIQRTLNAMHEKYYVYVAAVVPILHLTLEWIQQNTSGFTILGFPIDKINFPVSAALLFGTAVFYSCTYQIWKHFCPKPIKENWSDAQIQQYFDERAKVIWQEYDRIVNVEELRARRVEKMLLESASKDLTDSPEKLRDLHEIVNHFFTVPAENKAFSGAREAVAKLTQEGLEKEAQVARASATVCLALVVGGFVGTVIHMVVWWALKS